MLLFECNLVDLHCLNGRFDAVHPKELRCNLDSAGNECFYAVRSRSLLCAYQNTNAQLQPSAFMLLGSRCFYAILPSVNRTITSTTVSVVAQWEKFGSAVINRPTASTDN